MATPKDINLIFTMIFELAERESYCDEVAAPECLLAESLFGDASIATTLIASGAGVIDEIKVVQLGGSDLDDMANFRKAL